MYFYGKCWFITNNFCNSLKVRCFLHFDHTACHLRVLLLLLWSSHPLSLSVSLPFSFCLTLHQLCGKIWYILWITFISEWGRIDYWEWGALLCWFTGAVTLIWMFACKKKMLLFIFCDGFIQRELSMFHLTLMFMWNPQIFSAHLSVCQWYANKKCWWTW